MFRGSKECWFQAFEVLRIHGFEISRKKIEGFQGFKVLRFLEIKVLMFLGIKV
jgi:hypothetical protein